MRTFKALTVGAVMGGCCCSLSAEVDLSYRLPPDLALIMTNDGTGEFSAIGDIPGFDQVKGSSRTAGKRRVHILAIEPAEKYRVHITGRYETALTVNDTPWNVRVYQVGPVTLLLDSRGQMLEREMPPFDNRLRNLMTFAWLDYVLQQTAFPDVLPGRVVRPGDTWEGEATFSNPAGGSMVMRLSSKLLGRSVGGAEGWWFYSDGVLPISMRFSTPIGPYQVEGEVRTHTVSLFDTRQGFVTDRTLSMTISMDISLQRDPKLETPGQSFNMHMLVTAKNAFKTQVESHTGQVPAPIVPTTRPESGRR